MVNGAMSDQKVRIRLKFDSTPVTYAQKCWFTYDRDKCVFVGDVSHLIAVHFHLQDAGIQVIEEGGGVLPYHFPIINVPP